MSATRFHLGILLFSAVLLACAGVKPSDRDADYLETIEFVEEPIFSTRIRLINAGDPENPGVVLIHGLGQNGLEDWQHLIPPLTEQYHVLALDLPGFGQSEKPNVFYSPENYAQVIKFLVDRYMKEPVRLIGHSMGGAVALKFAARYPQSVDSLVLVDVAGILFRTSISEHILHLDPDYSYPLAKILKPAINTINILTRAATGGYGNARVQNMLYETLRDDERRWEFFHENTAAIAAVSLVLEDFSVDLETVSTPTLIVWSRDDGIAPLRTGKLLEYRLANASLKIIERGGHTPMLTEPEQFNHIVLTALAFPPPGKNLYPAPRNPPTNDRVLTCMGDDSAQEYTGVYNAIYIRDCSNKTLRNIYSRYLEINNSTVALEWTHVNGEHQGVTITESIVSISNSFIKGVDTGIYSNESRLEINRSRITAAGTGMVADNSIVELTGLDIDGNLALALEGSTIDAAGVHLSAKTHAIYTRSPQKIMFAVSRIKDKNIETFAHGPFIYDPEENLFW